MKYQRGTNNTNSIASFKMMGMPMPKPMASKMKVNPLMQQADDGLRKLAESGQLAHSDPAIRKAAKAQYDKFTGMKRTMGQYGKQY